MIVVVSQPMYFPWVGFMTQMSMADVLIWLDDAQFSKGSFTNRVQVKLPNGPKWMTIPLNKTGAFLPINQLSATNSQWINGHRAMLRQSFAFYKHAETAISIFDDVTSTDAYLCDSLIVSCERQAAALGCLPRSILRSSDMGVDGTSWQRVLRLVQAVGGTCYLTGHGAWSYLDHSAFNAAKVEVNYMRYDVKEWSQSYGKFTPFVTALDLIAAEGTSASEYLIPSSLDWTEFKVSK